RVAQLFSRQYCRKGYTWAALGLLITIGVLPALLFWQAARYFEMSLFLRWQQRKMAAAFVDRESPERRSELRAYGSALYETTIRPGSATPKKSRAGASTAECLLAKLSVPYNQTALEIRGSMGECWKHDTEMPVKKAPWEWRNSPDGRVELRNHDYTDSYTDGQDLVLSSQFPGLRWPR